MPTPNWGPQAGVPMDDATFDAYIMSNPPGSPQAGGLYRDTLAGKDGQGAAAMIAPLFNQNRVNYWSDRASAGPPQTFTSRYDPTNQDQSRLQQQQVIQALQAQAAGDPNSMAQRQLQQGYANAGSQQSSLGSTMRGQSAGAAMRGIQAGQQGIQRGFAGDQQMLMAQEQQAAQAMLAQLLGQQQGQDITQAQGMAQGQLGADATNDALRQYYMSAGASGDTNRLQTMQDFNRARYGVDLEAQKIQDENLKRALNAATTTISTGVSAFGGSGNKSSQQTIDDAFNG